VYKADDKEKAIILVAVPAELPLAQRPKLGNVCIVGRIDKIYRVEQPESGHFKLTNETNRDDAFCLTTKALCKLLGFSRDQLKAKRLLLKKKQNLIRLVDSFEIDFPYTCDGPGKLNVDMATIQ